MASRANAGGVFEGSPESTQGCPHAFSPLPGRISAAQILSPIPEGTDIGEADLGAQWLKLPLTPQGEEIAGVLQASAGGGIPTYDTAVVEAPRRSTKTTAILATLLGRGLCRPGYRIASTAQDGLRARAKLKEVMLELRRGGFEDAGLGTLYFSNGTERIEFANGAVWKAIPPDPGAFRSDAFDAVLIDEAGELEPEKADALLAGILPTQDTRPTAQTIVAGTPNVAVRAGLLWDTLDDLRNGEDGVGGVVYAAPDGAVFADLSDPDNPVYDWALVERTHPGIESGLTTLARIKTRLPKMGLAKFSSEYLCQWPSSHATAALDIEAWRDCESAEGLPPRPDRVGLAFDVAPDGQDAALVAAWRDEDGRAHLEVLACRGGSDWVPGECLKAATKHRATVSYDSIGQNIEVADKMTRPPYRTGLKPLNTRALVGASARFDKELRARRIVHYGQPDLTEAVEGAAWRPVGTDGRLFSRKASAATVAPLVAAAEALWAYDLATTSTGRTGIVSAKR